MRCCGSVEQRFWKTVDKSNLGGCWIWKGSIGGNGYGRISVGRRGTARRIPAHRLSWTITYGEIPEGINVLHRCDTPLCVNPEHLFLGTQGDNMRDKTEKGRGRSGSLPGEKNPNAKLNKDQILEIREKFAIGLMSQGQLAKIYGVKQQHISLIVRGKSWPERREDVA